MEITGLSWPIVRDALIVVRDKIEAELARLQERLEKTNNCLTAAEAELGIVPVVEKPVAQVGKVV